MGLVVCTFRLPPIASSITGEFKAHLINSCLGWEESGVDPADFAHALCDYMALGAYEYPYSFGGDANAPHPLRPASLLELGYQCVISDTRIPAGGSTACIGVANPEGILHTANLGDSGYAHLSPNRLNFVSDPQTHAFNTPFQFSKMTRAIAQQTAHFGGRPFDDKPSDASVSRLVLQHGDVLIFATDGMWDNLSSTDILYTTCRVMIGLAGWIVTPTGEVIVGPELGELALRPQKREFGLAAALATALLNEAKAASNDRKKDGPFAKEYNRHHPVGPFYRGGKPDDICILVVVACQE